MAASVRTLHPARPAAHSVVATILVILIEAGLAVGILTGGATVGLALVIGGLFSVLGGITGSSGETVGDWALAEVHFWLASGQQSGA